MKSIKGLFLIVSLMLATSAVVKADSTKLIEDDIFTAIHNIDYVSINVLLSDGVNVDTVNRQGNTPLMVAAKVGNLRILDIILSHNPDVNLRNKKGNTALMIAAQSGQLQVVKKLVAEGADLSIRDEKGNTALALASKFGHEEIANYITQLQTQASLAK